VAARFDPRVDFRYGPRPTVVQRLRTPRVRRRVLAVPLVCAGALALGYGCRPFANPVPPPPAWTTQPVTQTPVEPTASAAVVEPLPAVVAPREVATFDPATIVPILDEPGLREVRELVKREAYQAAADRLDALLQGPAGATPAQLFQLALLRVKAGMPGAAVTAFDRAAAVEGALADHAKVRAARLLVEMKQPADALLRLERVGGLVTLASEVQLLRARALVALRKVDEAAPIWQAYLAREPRPSDWQSESLRFARALLEEPSREHAEQALRLTESVIYRSSKGRSVNEARELHQRARLTLPFEERQRFDEPSREEKLARARGLSDGNQGREALALAEELARDLAKDNADAGEPGCTVHTARGKALATLKRYSESTDAFGMAIERCTGESLASAYFLGARSALRGGRPALARQRYAELEQKFPDHKLADDARVHGAEAARDLGDLATFTSMLLPIAADYPEGDMVDQGLFSLALARITDGDWAGAVLPLERAIARQHRGRPYWSEGRPQYFLGRAKLELGQREEGKALLVSVIREFPLSYFMLLAYARLASLDAALAQRTLEAARASEPAGAFVIPDHDELHRPEFLRAVELIRQGEGSAALRELEVLGVRERKAHPWLVWASAALLARIDAMAESHGLLRGAEAWSEHFPAGVWRPLWELAYPRPFRLFVVPASARFGIPEHLAYAIMREESAFKPNVSSPANAHGLMQLILPTAKKMAAPLGLAHDERALKTPSINVTLGCRFLSILTQRFAYNPLLAIPGYNAGPGAPERWLEQHPNADFDVFVESIPYQETREYTKRVMKTMAAYAFVYGKGLGEPLLLPPLKVDPTSMASASVSLSPKLEVAGVELDGALAED